MIGKPNSWSLVIAEFWNRMIFSPTWVAQTVFDRQDIETLISIIPKGPIIHQTPSVILEVQEERLRLVARSNHDDTLQMIENTALRVLETLPHTPIQGVGFNFGFIEQNPQERLLSHFDAPDLSQLEATGSVDVRAIKRILMREGRQHTLTLALQQGHVDIDINVHKSVDSSKAAADAIADQALVRLREVVVLLANYGLRLD